MTNYTGVHIWNMPRKFSSKHDKAAFYAAVEETRQRENPGPALAEALILLAEQGTPIPPDFAEQTLPPQSRR